MDTSGFREWEAAIDDVIARLRPAAERAISRSMDAIDRSAALVLSAKTHPEGTPTPSLPGEPPALVTGNLIRSYVSEGPEWIGPDVVAGRVGPSAVYARIQDLGGDVYAINYPQLGNPEVGFFGPHVYLPPRPYIEPSVEGARDEIEAIWREEITGALTR